MSNRLSINRLSMFRRDHARSDWVTPDLGQPGKFYQIMTQFTPAANGRAATETKTWSHGRYKVIKIRRTEDNNEEVLRVKVYESFAQLTVFIPREFHGVVARVGHSGRSISCSHAALYLKESNNLRFNCQANGTDDVVLVRTEKVLHVCVAEDDTPVAVMPRGNSAVWDRAPLTAYYY